MVKLGVAFGSVPKEEMLEDTKELKSKGNLRGGEVGGVESPADLTEG
jgi:hypothetical protein